MELKSVKHKGLQAMIAGGKVKGIPLEAQAKIRRQLSALEAAADIHQVQSLPGWQLKEKKGPWQGLWSMWVTGNFRLTFRLESRSGPVIDLDFLDYH